MESAMSDFWCIHLCFQMLECIWKSAYIGTNQRLLVNLERYKGQIRTEFWVIWVGRLGIFPWRSIITKPTPSIANWLKHKWDLYWTNKAKESLCVHKGRSGRKNQIIPYSTATNNIGQIDNVPEYRYQKYWSGLVSETIEFEQWAGT